MQISGKPGAIACVSEKSGKAVGTVRFFPKCDGVLLVADLCGLPQETGFLGFHIHEGARCAGESFSETGGHYNPESTDHPQHAGDLPPLLNCNGRAFLAVWTQRLTLGEVIGKTVVIHGGADDFRSQPAGMSGEKIACGEIRRL